jgi:hypothetical protein
LGARCTIKRPAGPLGVGVGVGLVLASVAQLEINIAPMKTKTHKILAMKFLFIFRVYSFPEQRTNNY